MARGWGPWERSLQLEYFPYCDRLMSIHIFSPKLCQNFPCYFYKKNYPFWRPQVGTESVSEMANIFPVFYTKNFPVLDTLFVPRFQYPFIPISNTLFIPVSDNIFIPVSDTLFYPRF